MNQQAVSSPRRLIRLRAVLDRYPKSRSGFLADVRAGVAPSPVKIGARAVAWVESEIDAFIEQQISASRAA
jgi:prophage regulatory protein